MDTVAVMARQGMALELQAIARYAMAPRWCPRIYLAQKERETYICLADILKLVVGRLSRAQAPNLA